jgi:hypothetical protein
LIPGGGPIGSHTAHRRVCATPDPDVPELPTAWRPVYGSEIATCTQRFQAYAMPDGARIALHSTVGAGAYLTGRLIALINLGSHRVALASDGDRFEARWSASNRRHRLTLEPTTLRDFTAVLFGLRWA